MPIWPRKRPRILARGVKPEEAHRRARIKLGNPRSVRETLWRPKYCLAGGRAGRDLKIRDQTLARSPGFFADRGHRDGLVHRRNYFAVHGWRSCCCVRFRFAIPAPGYAVCALP